MNSRKWLCILIVLATIYLCFIVGCAVKPTPIKGSGEAPPPHGWLEYCERHRDDPGCVGMDKL